MSPNLYLFVSPLLPFFVRFFRDVSGIIAWLKGRRPGVKAGGQGVKGLWGVGGRQELSLA